jgi:hypothetical protein
MAARCVANLPAKTANWSTGFGRSLLEPVGAQEPPRHCGRAGVSTPAVKVRARPRSSSAKLAAVAAIG